MDVRSRGRAVCIGLLVVGGLAGATQLLGHPVPASAAVDRKAQGAELFTSSGCTHCHGNDGQGTDRAPGLHDLRKKLSADKINSQIVHGGQGMPAFGDALKPDEVDALVDFLRAKRWTTPPAPKPDTPATPPPASPTGSSS